MSIIISTKNLTVSYGIVPVLQDISFAVEKGDYIGLAGPNGAGKTTLIKALLGLISGSGEVELFNQSLPKFKEWQKIGYLPQRGNGFNPLFPISVSEVVALGLLANKKYPKRYDEEDRKKITQALEMLQLNNIKDRLINELSGGQQQRVFLARAIVSQPELLILDEPSTALDPQIREDFFTLTKKLNAQGVTIVLITHDVSHIGQYANKLLYIDKKVIFYGKFSDFCHSTSMHDYFGEFSQHLICHQH
ncbi:MAG: metal ABC transporter ATP-binding protein [Planctomycetes bacterium]|jgi:zinc transport system ATP-binding protein|nr:metal ABC transporter ATP-binding protein [Planctomycetota bacterium]